jgi:hypothetical protein
MRKVFFTFGLIVLVAVAFAWYFITYRLDGVVETRIEKAASLALGSSVEVGGVKTNLRDGTLSVERISVANPAGYENAHAVRLNSVEAAVDYAGLVIKRVVIENPEFIIEEKDGKTNFSELMAALDSGSELIPESETKEPVIVIRHFRINESQAAFVSQSLDRYSDISVDAIELNDLRGTPSELAKLIANEVVGELSSEAATELLKAQALKKYDDAEE